MPAATDEDIDQIREAFNLFNVNFDDLNTFTDMKKCVKLLEFYEKHCISRTYFFQVRKCSDLDCPYHNLLRSNVDIEVLPDPVPKS